MKTVARKTGDFEAAYLSLYRAGELEHRVEEAYSALRDCKVCPRNCRADRIKDQRAFCHTGRRARVSSFFAHFGEEDCLRGWRGSGTIFFSFCNLKCVFCQNHDISQDGGGREVERLELASMMLKLQDAGCHNINFVTPEHVVPQILEGLLCAAADGLRLPIVYNSSGYDAIRSLELLDGIVDIYLPDFKFWNPELSFRYMKARDYPDVARRVIREMRRQVGDLKINGNGIAERGLLVRHLVMPGGLAGTDEIMRFLAREVSPETYVNIMGQYSPDYKAHRFPEINRETNADELNAAYASAHSAGLRRLGRRWEL
jgi:putative pyruvate formate lyase activating enzyme